MLCWCCCYFGSREEGGDEDGSRRAWDERSRNSGVEGTCGSSAKRAIGSGVAAKGNEREVENCENAVKGKGTGAEGERATPARRPRRQEPPDDDVYRPAPTEASAREALLAWRALCVCLSGTSKRMARTWRQLGRATRLVADLHCQYKGRLGLGWLREGSFSTVRCSRRLEREGER